MNLTITDDMLIDYVTGGITYTLDKMILNENGQDHLVYAFGGKYLHVYFTIESLEDGNEITFTKGSSAPANTFYYSTNDGDTWTSANSTTTWSGLNTGSKIMLKATANIWGNSGSDGATASWTFSSTKTFNVYGNTMSLLYGDDFIHVSSRLEYDYVFRSLFSGCDKLVDASNLILPATFLARNCYYEMFKGCTSLTAAPALPATNLTEGCYYYMFYGCTSLTAAPELPATTLSKNCYYGMFYNCSSLTAAPALPATTLADGCYYYMFYGCTSLTAAPELSATTLAKDCYYGMFQGCSSLVTVQSKLPATTLTESCYRSMFYQCTSLTTAPELPATTLANYCYRYMFNTCRSLTYVKCLATNKSATQCTSSWLSNVSASGTFVKNSAATWSSGGSGIPSGWTVVNAS